MKRICLFFSCIAALVVLSKACNAATINADSGASIMVFPSFYPKMTQSGYIQMEVFPDPFVLAVAQDNTPLLLPDRTCIIPIFRVEVLAGETCSLTVNGIDPVGDGNNRMKFDNNGWSYRIHDPANNIVTQGDQSTVLTKGIYRVSVGAKLLIGSKQAACRYSGSINVSLTTGGSASVPVNATSLGVAGITLSKDMKFPGLVPYMEKKRYIVLDVVTAQLVEDGVPVPTQDVPQCAEFYVEGASGTSFTCSVSSGVITLYDDQQNWMDVTDFKCAMVQNGSLVQQTQSYGSSVGGVIPSSISSRSDYILRVGATLNIGVKQAAAKIYSTKNSQSKLLVTLNYD